MDNFDGRDKWINLKNNQIVPPRNAFVGARIQADERALFNGEWKLYSNKPQLISFSPTYKLFNIVEDPFEKNDLSQSEPEILEEMSKFLSSLPERDVVGDMNPAHAYLHGDNEQGGVELGSPWLDGDYELNNPPSLFFTILISFWILIQAFKYYLLALIVIIFSTIYFVKKLR